MLELFGLTLRRVQGFTLRIPLLRLEQGERVTLLGPSGSGKSTLIRLLAGLESPLEGEIHLDGRCVNALPPFARAVSLLAQDFGLWPHLTALEHLAFSRSQGRALKPLAADRELLSRVHLAHKGEALPGFLSGGERQRLALARALSRRPRLLLLDEPFSGVDPVLAGELEDLLENLHDEWGLTRIQVRHWMHRAGLNERFLVMEKGEVVQDGSWQSLGDSAEETWTRRYTRLFT